MTHNESATPRVTKTEQANPNQSEHSRWSSGGERLDALRKPHDGNKRAITFCVSTTILSEEKIKIEVLGLMEGKWGGWPAILS